MKRIVTTILALFYLALSSSAAINLHYCGGELESIKINSNPVSCCCGDIEMPNSCCQDKELNLELDIDQQTISINSLVPSDILFITLFLHNNELFQDLDSEEIVIENYTIPPPKLEAIWLINCSLTFYG